MQAVRAAGHQQRASRAPDSGALARSLVAGRRRRFAAPRRMRSSVAPFLRCSQAETVPP